MMIVKLVLLAALALSSHASKEKRNQKIANDCVKRMIPVARSVDEVMNKCFKINKQSSFKQSTIHELKKQLSMLKADYLESDEEEHDSNHDDDYEDNIDDAGLHEDHESEDEYEDVNREEETPSKLGTLKTDNVRVTVADNGLEEILKVSDAKRSKKKANSKNSGKVRSLNSKEGRKKEKPSKTGKLGKPKQPSLQKKPDGKKISKQNLPTKKKQVLRNKSKKQATKKKSTGKYQLKGKRPSKSQKVPKQTVKMTKKDTAKKLASRKALVKRKAKKPVTRKLKKKPKRKIKRTGKKQRRWHTRLRKRGVWTRRRRRRTHLSRRRLWWRLRRMRRSRWNSSRRRWSRWSLRWRNQKSSFGRRGRFGRALEDTGGLGGLLEGDGVTGFDGTLQEGEASDGDQLAEEEDATARK